MNNIYYLHYIILLLYKPYKPEVIYSNRIRDSDGWLR